MLLAQASANIPTMITLSVTIYYAEINLQEVCERVKAQILVKTKTHLL